MQYSLTYLEQRLCVDLGEMDVVLDSGKTYELHIHDTEFIENGDTDTIKTEGLNDDGEYVFIEFPVSAVEQIRHHAVV